VIFSKFLVFSISFAEELSQAVYEVIEELDVKATMRDGVRLSTNIYRGLRLLSFRIVVVDMSLRGFFTRLETKLRMDMIL